ATRTSRARDGLSESGAGKPRKSGGHPCGAVVMTGYRIIFGITASIGLHVASVATLNKPAPPEERPKKPTVVELAALPPPPPKPTPPEPPPSEPPEQKPNPQPRATPVKVMELPPPAPPPQNVPPTSTPLVLAGLSMSNAGVS